MDINSIIEMIEKVKKDKYFLNELEFEAYQNACDDIIEQLRKMSDKPKEIYGWVWLFSNGSRSCTLFDTQKQAEDAWSRLAGGKAVPLYK